MLRERIYAGFVQILEKSGKSLSLM